MSARDRILDRLRRASAARPGGEAATPVAANTLPEEQQAWVDVFVQQARQSGTTVETVRSEQETVEALRALTNNAPLAIADEQLRERFPELANDGPDEGAVLAEADAAIAETGTFCLHSGRQPSGPLFLCEHLVVLLDARGIVRYLEHYWRERPAQMQRAVHLITGPSRTADVEQTLQIGAHGPRAMSCLLRR